MKALLCARAHELEEEHEQLRHAADRIDDLIDDCLEPVSWRFSHKEKNEIFIKSRLVVSDYDV